MCQTQSQERIGLLLEFGNKKEGTLTLKDCKFTNIIIEKDGTGCGCGGAFETGNYYLIIAYLQIIMPLIVVVHYQFNLHYRQ